MNETVLDNAYNLDGVEVTQSRYSARSTHYDAKVEANGCATPTRIAQSLAGLIPLVSRILNFGCGTGLSGLTLRSVGFSQIDGCDISADMLDQARSVYQNYKGHLPIIDLNFMIYEPVKT